MTLLQEILVQSPKAGMVSYLKAHPQDFPEAIDLALSDNQPYAWRAASLLWGSMEENDPRLTPFIFPMIEALPSKAEGHRRDLLMVLLRMDLPEEAEGIMLDYCVGQWTQETSIPSLRFTALRMLMKLARKYPELAPELTTLTDERYKETLTEPGRRSLRKMGF